MTERIFLGDFGTVFELEILDQDGSVVDVSGATTKEVVLENPNGKATSYAASFTTDGTDGKIEYTLKEGDVDKTGIWRVQGYIVLPAGEWYTAKDNFVVEEAL